jgi:hypothetical protein
MTAKSKGFDVATNRIGGKTDPKHIDRLQKLLNVPHGVRFIEPEFHFGETGTLLKIEPVRGRVNVCLGPEWFDQADSPGWFVVPADETAVAS